LLGEALRAATTSNVPCAIMFLDLDGFKPVNDTFGHPKGDAVLRAVAKRLVDQVGDEGYVGRMGGDEFAVILVQADQAVAAAKAAALADAVERDPIRFGDWTAPLHLSFGVRQITADAEPETLVAEADAAMYAQKRARTAR
jgi:diguanylate cyclase (GGDEF)-like protein